MATSIAQAVVGGLGLVDMAMDLLFPPIPSSPTTALNVNPCGTMSSFLFYQLFTRPPLPPNPVFFCLSLRLQSSAIAVISSTARW